MYKPPKIGLKIPFAAFFCKKQLEYRESSWQKSCSMLWLNPSRGIQTFFQLQHDAGKLDTQLRRTLILENSIQNTLFIVFPRCRLFNRVAYSFTE